MNTNTCISCSTAADPTGIKPAESIVTNIVPTGVETGLATSVQTGVGEDNKAVKPLEDQGGIYGNLASATAEQLRMQLAILEKQNESRTSIANETNVDDNDNKKVGGENEK
jgi:hypothetical protein